MSHIAIDARHINSSTGTYIYNLIKNLEKIDRKNNYTLIIPNKESYVPAHKNFKISICKIKLYSIKEQFQFKFFLDNLKPDLVHFCMPSEPILYSGKKITTIHDLNNIKIKHKGIKKIKQPFFKFFLKKICANNDYIICPSKWTLNDLSKKFDVKRPSEVIYEAGMDEVKPKPKSSKKSYLLYVGSQIPHKNISRLIEAHQKLLSEFPDLELKIVGKINYKGSIEHKNVSFVGFVPKDKLAQYYKNALAYVFPSKMEGFGLPGLEAMSNNCPVISSNATCLPEVYGNAAHYFDPFDTDDIAIKIKEVITDKELQKKLVQYGEKQLKKYSWTKCAKEHLAVYERVLNDK